jgi:hypothetical protein
MDGLVSQGAGHVEVLVLRVDEADGLSAALDQPRDQERALS